MIQKIQKKIILKLIFPHVNNSFIKQVFPRFQGIRDIRTNTNTLDKKIIGITIDMAIQNLV